MNEQIKSAFKLPFKNTRYGNVTDQNGHLAFQILPYLKDEVADKIVARINEEPVAFENTYVFESCADDHGTINMCLGSAKKPFILIRGWGYLTGTGGLRLSSEAAAEVQDELEKHIVKQLNKKVWPNRKVMNEK